MKKKIACLPVAGIENPYQQLMIKGLNSSSDLYAFSGVDNKLWGIICTAILKYPKFIHFDWITPYYYRRNLFLTIMSIPNLILQLLILKLMNIKTVLTIHNVYPHDCTNIKIHYITNFITVRLMNRIRVFSSDTIERANYLKGINKNKIFVIPEGSYIEYYSKYYSNDTPSIIINNIKKRALFFGNIKKYKGIIDLIEFFKKLNDKWVLTIAGKLDDELFREQVISKVNEATNITLIDNFIPESKVYGLFNSCDLVVLPFIEIENSGSIILAMGFKKPIISCNKGVVKKRLHKQSKLLFEESIHEKYDFMQNITSLELKEIGESNYVEVLKYNWSDFARIFK